MQKYFNKIFGLLLLILFNNLFLPAQTTENELKAAFIEKFALFTEWPDSVNVKNLDEPFKIAVIGRTELYGTLKRFYSEQNIRGKLVRIEKIQNYQDIKDHQILFIGSSEKYNLKKIIDFTSSKPILTISDTEGFAAKGVLINYFIDENKIRFEINEKAVRKSGLYMSYHLLKYARIVSSDEN